MSATTVFAAFAKSAATHAKRPFLRAPAAATRGYAENAIEYSYADAREAVERLRGRYLALGLAAGDRVALAFDSRLDVYLHLLALNAESASIVPLNMAGRDEELLYLLRHSRSRLMSGAERHLGRLEQLAAQAGNVRVFDAAPSAGTPEPGPPGGDIRNEAALLYTSGTTGRPKGCMLSNDYFLTTGLEYGRLGGLCAIDCHDRLLTPLPPSHMNALATSFMAMLLCGGCVIQLDRFHPRDWWRTVRDEGATVIHYLGVMPAILLQLPEGGDEDFSAQVRFGFGAGSDPRHQAAFEKRFGFPLVEAWAMTETGGAGMTVAHIEPRHVGERCIGRPIPDAEYRLVDVQGQDVAAGEPGELLVRRRGANPRQGFFSGYFRDEPATAEGWRDGWWHTGDLVREGPDGSLFFVDRQKNVIRRSGENIAAVEVEAALLQSDAVANCAVTAVPDEIRGDEVFAFIVPADGVTDPAQLAHRVFDFAVEKLAYYKAPGYVAVVDELPVTASQKISRGEIKQRAAGMVAARQVTDLRARKKGTPR